MAEATSTKQAVFDLKAGTGCGGAKLIAMVCAISDAETLATGLKEVIACGNMIETSGGPTDTGGHTIIDSISGGTITFGTGQWTTNATGVNDVTTHLLIVGKV